MSDADVAKGRFDLRPGRQRVGFRADQDSQYSSLPENRPHPESAWPVHLVGRAAQPKQIVFRHDGTYLILWSPNGSERRCTARTQIAYETLLRDADP